MILIDNIINNHYSFWIKKNAGLLFGGLAFFLLALFVQHFSYIYIDGHIVTTPVEDVLLNNLPTMNLDFFVMQAPLILTFIILALFLIQPKYLPFSIKALALFIIIRSFFITLTHLGANLHQLQLDETSFGFGMYDFLYNAKNDFFFSGHVGTPFLMAMIFWKDRTWRYFFLTSSAVLGVAMLLAHMHYSIDIFAAPFITYSIYVIAKETFYEDFKLIKN